MVDPLRLQRRRTRGAKLPEGTVDCTRSGPWGNPFIVNPHVSPGSKSGAAYICVPTLEDAIECFREMVSIPDGAEFTEAARQCLRGRNLACWCALCPDHAAGRPWRVKCDACPPCHCDVLLEIANG